MTMQVVERTSVPQDAMVVILGALNGLKRGDDSVRLPLDWQGTAGRVAEVFNDVVERNNRMANELERLSRVVGKEGKLGRRGTLGDVTGFWRDSIDAVNQLIDDLVHPTSETARVIGAVAQGDLSQTMALEVDGEALQGEFLRTAKTVNKMVDQLGSFAAEVTRVARDVGTEGKLGGQAKVKGVAGTWKDLTDSVNSMAGNLTDQRKNEFIAMLAHELRNPLAPIRNALHLLQYADGDPIRASWARDIIHRQLRQLVRLVDDLLDLSRITRGKIDLKIETIDVAEVVAAAVETSKPTVDDLGHTMTLALPAEPLRIRGDFARVAQVLGNIINNAAKYTGRGGSIALDVTRDNGQVVFRVRDTGVGIAKEYLTSIFEPFTQLARTIDRSQGGLGIGLTLVQRLVEMQGGSVSAHSEGRDRGSEFVVRLPASSDFLPSAPPAETRQSVVQSGTRPMSVLVVDDNVDVAESTAIVLRVTGCEVHLAHDGKSALESVLRLSPDVVLLDIGLPGMDGYQVAEQIRARPEHKDTLLLAISGYGQEEHRDRSKKAGFDHHLVKPIDPIALMELMRAQRGDPAASAPR